MYSRFQLIPLFSFDRIPPRGETYARGRPSEKLRISPVNVFRALSSQLYIFQPVSGNSLHVANCNRRRNKSTNLRVSVSTFLWISEYLSRQKNNLHFSRQILTFLRRMRGAALLRLCFSDWLRQRELISLRFSSRRLSTDFHSDRVSAKSISVSHFNFSSCRSRHLNFFRVNVITRFIHSVTQTDVSRIRVVISNHAARNRSNFLLRQFQLALILRHTCGMRHAYYK